MGIRIIKQIIRTSLFLLLFASVFCCLTENQEPNIQQKLTPNDIVQSTREILAHTESQTHYLTIGDEFSLSVWLADETINPDAQGNDMETNKDRAMLTAIHLGREIIQQQPGILDVFSTFNPMIVDKHYNAWYIDFIPFTLLLHEAPLTDDEWISLFKTERIKTAYIRLYSSGNKQANMINSAKWKTIQAQISSKLKKRSSTGNFASYIIHYNEMSLVQLYWDKDFNDPESKPDVLNIGSDIRSYIQTAAIDIDKLEFYITTPRGKTHIFAYIRKDVIQKKEPLCEEELMIHYLF